MGFGGRRLNRLFGDRTSCHFLPVCVLAVVLSVHSGCGYRSSDIDLADVSGTVTLDGKPLANVLLTFVPDTGRSSFGTTDAAGFYQLKYTGDTDGAVLGEHKVVIESLAAVDGGFSDPSIEHSNADSKELVPRKYNARSTLKREVASGSNTIDFELTSR